MIGALVVKDLKLFIRNRFFLVITALGLVVYPTIYYLIPDQVDESLGLAFYIEDRETPLYRELVEEPDDYAIFESEEEMLAALEETGDYFVGLSIPAQLSAAAARGEQIELKAYYAPGVPAEARQIFNDVLVVVANTVNPDMLASLARFNETKVVLGNDLLGAPLSLRSRFVPLFLMMVVLIEVFGLSAILNRDIENGTARALVSGPLRMSQLFAGKALVGMILAFGQVLLLGIIMGAIGTSPLLLLATLLLGSLLMVGVGFLIAALAKDNPSVLAWSILFIIPLTVPGLLTVLPGLATSWMEIIPSFYFVDSLHRILNFGAGWADVSGNLAMLFVVGAGTLAIGTASIRRRI